LFPFFSYYGNVTAQLYIEFASLTVGDEGNQGLLATLREVQSIDELTFASDVPFAAAAAAAAEPVELDIDWGDLVVVDQPTPASSDGALCSVTSDSGGAREAGIDIDWNVVTIDDGLGAAGEISWDVDVAAADEGGEHFAIASGNDEDYGISISTDGVSGKANVFEDPERYSFLHVDFTSA
jgi:hypothetical protein